MVASVTRRSTVRGEGAYVAATLGVGIPNLATLTDRFAVSPDGTMLVIVDGDYGGLALRHMSALELSPIAGSAAKRIRSRLLP